MQAGSLSQRTLSETNLDVAQQPYTSLNEAFEALNSGEVDYVLCGAYSGGYLAAAYDDVNCAGTISAPTVIGVGVPSAKTGLAASMESAMQSISTNGVLDVLRSKWVQDLPQLNSNSLIGGIGAKAEAATDDTAAADDSGATDSTDTTETADATE